LISCKLLDGLQQLRNNVGVPLYVNQPDKGLFRRGFRTVQDNKAAGGVHNSQHLLGRAADVDAGGEMTPYALAQEAKKIECFKKGGIIIYRSFVHLDVRPNGPYHGEK
jgi:zinc D-Ala-D-Ala carboxypeptidase